MFCVFFQKGDKARAEKVWNSLKNIPSMKPQKQLLTSMSKVSWFFSGGVLYPRL